MIIHIEGEARMIMSTGHTKCHMKFMSSLVLNKIVEVLEYEQCKRYVIHNT